MLWICELYGFFPFFWVDIPADRLSFVLEGKQNACWFYSNPVVRSFFLIDD